MLPFFFTQGYIFEIPSFIVTVKSASPYEKEMVYPKDLTGENPLKGLGVKETNRDSDAPGTSSVRKLLCRFSLLQIYPSLPSL